MSWNSYSPKPLGNFAGFIDVSSELFYPPEEEGKYWVIKNDGYLSYPNPSVELYISGDTISSLTSPEVGDFVISFPASVADPVLETGKFGNALAFSGNAKRFTYAYTDSGLKSIRFWFKFGASSSTQPSQRLAMFRRENNRFACDISWDQTTQQMVANGFGYVNGNFNFAANEWHHLEFKIDHDNGIASLLVDGVLLDTENFTFAESVSYFEIGSRQFMSEMSLDNIIIVNNHDAYNYQDEINPVSHTQFFKNEDLLLYDKSYPLYNGWLKLKTK